MKRRSLLAALLAAPAVAALPKLVPEPSVVPKRNPYVFDVMIATPGTDYIPVHISGVGTRYIYLLTE